MHGFNIVVFKTGNLDCFVDTERRSIGREMSIGCPFGMSAYIISSVWYQFSGGWRFAHTIPTSGTRTSLSCLQHDDLQPCIPAEEIVCNTCTTDPASNHDHISRFREIGRTSQIRDYIRSFLPVAHSGIWSRRCDLDGGPRIHFY
jgi:hypothetical protein